MVEATKSECAAFENSLMQPAGERPKIVPGTRKKITWPNGYSGRPYICLYFKFDLDAEGAPNNIEALFKAPDNVGYGFLRSATRSIQSWRYKLPESAPEGYEGVTTKVTIEVMPRHRYWYSIQDYPGAYPDFAQ